MEQENKATDLYEIEPNQPDIEMQNDDNDAAELDSTDNQIADDLTELEEPTEIEEVKATSVQDDPPSAPVKTEKKKSNKPAARLVKPTSATKAAQDDQPTSAEAMQQMLTPQDLRRASLPDNNPVIDYLKENLKFGLPTLRKDGNELERGASAADRLSQQMAKNVMNRQSGTTEAIAKGLRDAKKAYRESGLASIAENFHLTAVIENKAALDAYEPREFNDLRETLLEIYKQLDAQALTSRAKNAPKDKPFSEDRYREEIYKDLLTAAMHCHPERQFMTVNAEGLIVIGPAPYVIAESAKALANCIATQPDSVIAESTKQAKATTRAARRQIWEDPTTYGAETSLGSNKDESDRYFYLTAVHVLAYDQDGRYLDLVRLICHLTDLADQGKWEDAAEVFDVLRGRTTSRKGFSFRIEESAILQAARVRADFRCGEECGRLAGKLLAEEAEARKNGQVNAQVERHEAQPKPKAPSETPIPTNTAPVPATAPQAEPGERHKTEKEKRLEQIKAMILEERTLPEETQDKRKIARGIAEAATHDARMLTYQKWLNEKHISADEYEVIRWQIGEVKLGFRAEKDFTASSKLKHQPPALVEAEAK